ncbi:MAG TPA: hypothetical protein VHZ95_23005, partial [Polyangiales bacterium]|nr:hypothetical protein [Polyangiales bacterium]
MKARLSAVQQALYVLLITSLVFAFIARPHPANRRTMAALDEMSTFRDGFKRAELEKSLLDYARAQGVVSLAGIQRATRGRDVPTLYVAKGAPDLQPSAAVTLRSLEDIRLRARADSRLTIGLVHSDAIGAALAWRLTRNADAGSGTWTLTNIELVPAHVEQADVDLELQVAQLRLDRANAQRAVNDASKKLDTAEQIFETRRKWKLPWKQLIKSDEARKAARTTLEEDQRALTAADQTYEASAKRAEASRPPSPPSAAFEIARVSLDHGASHLHFDVPVAIEQRAVAVPLLRTGEFNATRDAGLWEEVKDLDADAAVAAIRTHFNWHYRYVELLGIRLGGMTVLQFLPCLLPLLQILLLLRTRA